MKLSDELNADQLAAVQHGDGPQLVLAGAGSGKTRVITYRISWLVREVGIEPYRIAAVTFTNKAAAEMKERVETLLGVPPGERMEVFVGTFHRFALQLLRRYGDRIGLVPGFTILDTTDQMALMKQALIEEGVDPSSVPPRAALSAVSGAKNRLLTVAEYEAEASGYFESQIVKGYRGYQRLLREGGAVDFDDMIAGAVRLLEREPELGERMRHRLRHLLVDEFQDTNIAQLRLIECINGRGGNLTAVGDEDQGIYLWRGAEIDNILEFERFFANATVRRLERNYRSTQTILDVSGGLIAHNVKRRGKTLWTDAGSGDPVTVHTARDEGEEARWVVRTMTQLNCHHRYSDMAILVRTNAQTRVLEDELLRRKIPYSLVAGVRFYERAEVKDLVAYLRVLRNPKDNLSLRRILNVPTRGIGRATQDALITEAEESGHSLWEVLARGNFRGQSTRAERILREFRELIAGLREEAYRLDLYQLLVELLARTGYLAPYKKRGDEDSQARLENIEEFLSAAREFADDYQGLGLPLLQRRATPPETNESRSSETTSGASAAARQDQFDSATASEDSTTMKRQVDLFSAVGEFDRQSSAEGSGASALGSRPGSGEGAEFDSQGNDVLTAFLDYVALVSDTDGLQTEIGVSVMTLHSSKGLEFPVVFLTGLEDGLLPHFNSATPEQMEEERRLLYVGMTRARQRLFLSNCLRRRVAGRYQDQLPSPFLLELPENLIESTCGADVFQPYSGSRLRPDPKKQAAILSFFQGTNAGVDGAATSSVEDQVLGAAPGTGPREPSADPGADDDQAGSSGSAWPRSPYSHRSTSANSSNSSRSKQPAPPPGVAAGLSLRRGVGVRHPTLGPGVILAVEGEGDNAKLTVYFDKAGKRRLIAKFASLEPLV